MRFGDRYGHMGALLVGLVCGSLGCAHAVQQPVAPAPWCSAQRHDSAEQAAGVSGALLALNQQFLAAHAEARGARCAWLSEQALVMRYAAGSLEARFQGHDILKPTSVLPAAYHPLKDVAHSLFLAALVASEGDSTRRAQHTAEALAAITRVQTELVQPSSPARLLIPAEHVERQVRLLAQAAAALRAPDLAAARAELQAAQGDLQVNLSVVASATLRGLHDAVQAVRTQLVAQHGEPAWASLLVVVAVAHQARAQALEVQYFERLLREPMKEGARGERRLVVAENVGAPGEQFGLLAMHLVDQEGGRLVFGEPARLQRDVLADYNQLLDELLPAREAP